MITGCAGFIGATITRELLQQGYKVIGIDNLNTYYDVNLKQARLRLFNTHPQFSFYAIDIKEEEILRDIFLQHRPWKVIHLAAQAGVRYSIDNPSVYIQSNLVGFANILEMCRQFEVAHLVFASSSSVYGNNPKIPFCVTDPTDQPISLYAATKKSNELMAHAYHTLYHFPITGLRYFTVYGPWGRPDMAPFKFVERILNNQTIAVYNNGNHQRDFTYIDDIVAGTLKVFDRPVEKQPFKIYNIGYGQPNALLDFIALIEQTLGKKAQLDFQPAQPGDVDTTWADISELRNDTGYVPQTPLAAGIPMFVRWYKDYYQDLRKTRSLR